MQFKKSLKIIFWFFLAFFIAGLFIFINISNIVESQIEKKLSLLTDVHDLEFDVKKIGLFNTLVSDIRVGKGISIDSLNIDYTNKNFSSIHIGKLTLSGLTIHAKLDENNQINIEGLEFLKTDPTKKPDIKRVPDLSFPAFLPEQLVLKNAKIILTAMDHEFLIPFDVLSTLSKEDEAIISRAIFYPFGDKITSLITYDMNKGIKFLKIEGKGFDSGHINSFISHKIKGVQLKGPIDFNIESFSPSKNWKINFHRIGLIQPIETSAIELNTILKIDEQRINASGTFKISGPGLPETPMEYDLTLDLINGLENNETFDLNFKNTNKDSYEISHKSILANIKNPQLNARFHGTPLKSKGKITLSLEQGGVQAQTEKLSFAGTKIESDIVADFSDKGKGVVSSTISVTANQISLKSDGVDSSFPSVRISGELRVDNQKKPSFNLTLKAGKGNLTSLKYKTKAEGIKIEIPIQYPHGSKKSNGKYSITEISYNNQFSFGTEGNIRQTGSKEFKVDGSLALKTLPHVQTRFDSILGFENRLGATLEFKISPFKLKFADIEKLVPQKLQAADVDMTVSAKGKAEFLNHQMKTTMRLNITDGTIGLPDMNFTAAGINTHVDFNDLLVPESVPGQVLTIDTIKSNKIEINDTKVQFSIEDGRSLLVENIKFKWCNGRVSTESIRFPHEKNTYALTLYCDRLELTSLLRQMGAFNAEGTGTLNGRIPVVYSDGNISFDNGFLFSTPGSGGKIVIENTDIITAGIPMDSPEFVQLDLAREALKGFDYKWAKLIFNTFEDTLTVNMELDGKPSRLLPFVYKKELGGFIRVDSSSAGSNFQGIKLDVNLKLPFNEVMKFGKTIKTLLK